VPGGEEQDYRVFIGAEAFDPRDVAARLRRRAEAAGPAADEAAPKPTIVQFERPLSIPDIERLRNAYGLGLDRFLPNLAFLETLASETLERLRQDFLVRETMPLDPELKLSPAIAGDVALFDAALIEEADPVRVESALASAGAADIDLRDDRPAGGSLTVRFALDDQARLPEVAEIGDVLWIEPVG
jgi:hypothetical protein